MQKLTGIFIGVVLIVMPLTAVRPAGTISGKVTEYLRNTIITGVHVQVVNTKISTLSGVNGEFKLPGMPLGSYTLKFTAEGFKPVMRTDVLVRP